MTLFHVSLLCDSIGFSNRWVKIKRETEARYTNCCNVSLSLQSLNSQVRRVQTVFDSGFCQNCPVDL